MNEARIDRRRLRIFTNIISEALDWCKTLVCLDRFWCE